MVMAAEHPMVRSLVEGTEREDEVMAFADRVKAQAAIDRGAADVKKEGVWTGRHVVNPVNGEHVQLWVANYVLMEYGTGAVMAVPAHDQRDFEFAREHGLPTPSTGSRTGRPWSRSRTGWRPVTSGGGR